MTRAPAGPFVSTLALIGILLGAMLFALGGSERGWSTTETNASGRTVVVSRIEPRDPGQEAAMPRASMGVTRAALLPPGNPGHMSWLVFGIVATGSGLLLATLRMPRKRIRHGRFDNRGYG